MSRFAGPVLVLLAVLATTLFGAPLQARAQTGEVDPGLYQSGIVVCPTDPDLVYIGMGEVRTFVIVHSGHFRW